MKKTLLFLFSLFCFSESIYAIPSNKDFQYDWQFILFQDQESNANPNISFLSQYEKQFKEINLPHDWAYEAGYHQDAAQKQFGGYAIGGMGYYKKDFNVSSSDYKDLRNGGHLFIDFDGVYMNAEVWINGTYKGKHPYGYTSFSYDLSPQIRKGQNSLIVKVDNNKEPSTRWYHPCGIYAPVELRKTASTFFIKDQQVVSANIKGDKAVLTLTSRQNITDATICRVQLFDKNQLLDEKEEKANDSLSFHLTCNNPQRWSPNHPYLYRVIFSLIQDKKIIEQRTIPYGFRTFSWDAATGFYLNGKGYKLRGVCEHLEGGPVGGAYTKDLLRWKLQLLKDMGVNAIRTTHNPQVPFFYDLCDEMGLLVMDEIFDGWSKKATYDYGQQAFAKWWQRDVTSWVERDRNHACIFLYSLGNETRGNDIAKKLLNVVHHIDSTRLCTSGNSAISLMDVQGYNGGSESPHYINNYKVGNKTFIGTETPHTWQVRSYYRTLTWYRDGYSEKNQRSYKNPDLTDKEVFYFQWASPDKRNSAKQIYKSSYDNASVRISARRSIAILRDSAWYSGSFRWTGFDYRGESAYVSGGWPFRLFSGGALDIAGFPKDLYYLYQSAWTTKDMAHILPHWSFPKVKIGTTIPVWVYTTGDEVELFLNGHSLGRQKKGKSWNKMQCQWNVPYVYGTLEAVAYRKGKKIASDKQITEIQPTKLKIITNNTSLKSDKQSILPITIKELGEHGTLYPFGENRIFINIDGPARAYCFENGCPNDDENTFLATSRKAFMGLARLFVQSTNFKKKPITITFGSILGKHYEDTNLYALIDVQAITLNGKKKNNPSYRCYYSTDGSTPTLSSTSVAPQEKIPYKWGDVIKVKVYDGKHLLLNMNEAFTAENSIYWGDSEDTTPKEIAMQAESAKLNEAFITNKNGENYHQKGWVQFKKKGASITFYQENDGEKTMRTLSIRYSQHNNSKTSPIKLFNNKKFIKTIHFNNTGVMGKDWKELTVEIPIYNGGNNLKFVSQSKEGPSIDQIKFID